MRRTRRALCCFSMAMAIAVLQPAAGARADDEFVIPPQAERAAVAALLKNGARLQIDADYRVVNITLGANSTNEDLSLLGAFERLESIQLSNSAMTDESLENFKGLTNLKRIAIYSDRFSEAGLAALRAALPNCQIASLARGGFGGFANAGAAPANDAFRRRGGAREDRGPGRRDPAGGPFGAGGFGGGPTSTSSLARINAVQDDLKLTPEQRQQIATATDPVAARREVDESVFAVLAPEQQARLKQLVLQQAGAAALLREDIAAALMLTSEQQSTIRKLWDEARENSRSAATEVRIVRTPGGVTAELLAKLRETLRELDKQRDERLLVVLTDDQRSAWNAMLGPELPTIGPGGGFGERWGGGFRGAGFTASATSVARVRAVQEDLKLTPEQREQISAATNPAALRAAMDHRVAVLLSPEQRARLKQIELQQLGAAALLREEVAGSLMLSTEQQASIRELLNDAAAQLNQAASEARARNPQSGAELFATFRELSAKLNSQRDEKILAALTEEQRQAWQEMLGPPGPPVRGFPERTTSGGFGPRRTEPADR